MITGVQYWISSYLVIVLGMEEKQVYKFYVTTCLTAPLIGVASGGFTFSQIGGYKSRQSFGLSTIMTCIGALIALPIPFLKTVN